jgi:hypothetical protein
MAANTAGAGANKSNAPGSYQQLLMAESLWMIVDKIWKLTNEVRVRLARDKAKKP